MPTGDPKTFDEMRRDEAAPARPMLPPIEVPIVSIAKLALADGDILVIKCGRTLDAETTQHVYDRASELFPKDATSRILILDHRFDISVLTKADIGGHTVRCRRTGEAIESKGGGGHTCICGIGECRLQPGQ